MISKFEAKKNGLTSVLWNYTLKNQHVTETADELNETQIHSLPAGGA